MMPPSYMVRVRLIILALICVILWQTLKYFPGLSPFPNEDLSVILEPLGSQETLVPPVTVDVYYEALCPDSRSFFTKQLMPAFEKASHLMAITLVPYGKASTQKSGDEYTFTCQHGPTECKANKVHACAIAKVSKWQTKLKYITCMISDNLEPMEIGESCAKEFAIDWDVIFQCSIGKEGSELLKGYGDATHSLRPRPTFIPTIVLNGSQENQAAILKNLLKEICEKFESKPVECREPS